MMLSSIRQPFFVIKDNEPPYQCVDRERINIFLKELSEIANNAFFSAKKFYDDLDEEERQKFYLLALQWIYYFGTMPTSKADIQNGIFVDDRNRASVMACRDIVKTEDFQKEISRIGTWDYIHPIKNIKDPEGMAYSYLLDWVNREMHNTLMQTATGLMIYSLQKKLDIGNYHLPLI